MQSAWFGLRSAASFLLSPCDPFLAVTRAEAIFDQIATRPGAKPRPKRPPRPEDTVRTPHRRPPTRAHAWASRLGRFRRRTEPDGERSTRRSAAGSPR